MALVGIELETLVYEPDALTTRPLFLNTRPPLLVIIGAERVSGKLSELWLYPKRNIYYLWYLTKY